MTSTLSARSLIRELSSLKDKEYARGAERFFKMRKGEYAYGDVMWGIRVPDIRKVALGFVSLPQKEVDVLLRHKVHECRYAGLEIMVAQYAKARKEGERRKMDTLARTYLSRLSCINNWDLVDTSAPYLLGEYCLMSGKEHILAKLARSRVMWERRVAIVSTLAYIKAGKEEVCTRIAQLLLGDTHDLIHKATGWMLREVGKKSPVALLHFLDTHAREMPRTMLRYALERQTPSVRKKYMNKR